MFALYSLLKWTVTVIHKSATKFQIHPVNSVITQAWKRCFILSHSAIDSEEIMILRKCSIANQYAYLRLSVSKPNSKLRNKSQF